MMFDMNIPKQISTEEESMQDGMNRFSQWRGKNSTCKGQKLVMYCRRGVRVCCMCVARRDRSAAVDVCVREGQRAAVDVSIKPVCLCVCVCVCVCVCMRVSVDKRKQT